MSVPLEVVSGSFITRGRCKYNLQEHTLFFDSSPETIIDDTRIPLLAADINEQLRIPEISDIVCYIHYRSALSLKFVGLDQILSSFDAFIDLFNPDFCSPVVINEPQVTGSGSLKIVEKRNESDNLLGGNIYAVEYCDQSRIVRFKLSSSLTKEFWQVGTSIIAGMNDSELTELYFSDLLIE